MILIHTALQCEAQCIIDHYKLKKINSDPKVYLNERLLILIGGVGKENTLKNLTYIFNRYSITKAFNIGIAGCEDRNIPIGALFSCYNKFHNIKLKELQTIDSPKVTTFPASKKSSTLYDMEASYFLQIVNEHLEQKEIHIFKIVSDYCDKVIKDKEAVKQLVYKNKRELLKKIE